MPTKMNREQAVALCQKLKAHVDSQTPGAENEVASMAQKLAEIRREFSIRDDELIEKNTHTGMTPDQERLVKIAFDPATGRVNYKALDELVDTLPSDGAKVVLKCVSTGVRFMDALFKLGGD